MNTIPLRPLVLAAALSALASAQESMRDVVPGRDFTQQKLLTPGLTDVWKLAVEQDEMLWCQVDSSSFDPVLDLVGHGGEVIATNDGAGTHSELWVRAPAKGDVEFRVRPFQGSGGGIYTFWLHRFCTETLGADATATHRFGPEQWWHYRVALRAGDVLVPTVQGEGRLTMVFDAERANVAEALGGYAIPHDGDYFVRVEGPRDRACRTLTQLARRRDLPLDEPRDESVGAFGLDHWRFPVRAGEAFVLDLRMPRGGLSLNQIVDTQRDDRQPPAFVQTGALDKGGQVRRYHVARRDTMLELRLRNDADAVVPYRLAIVRPERAIDVGVPANDRLPLGDGVLYRLSLAAGQLVRLDLDSEQFDPRFDLWSPDGTVLASADDRGPLDRGASHTFLVGESGIYRVLVWQESRGGCGTFALTATALDVPQLTASEPVTVHADPRGPTYLHLDLHDGDVVWLSVQSRAFDACLQVLDPAGNGDFCCEGGGIGGDVLCAYRSSHTGRHTLLVHSRSGAGDGEVRLVPQQSPAR
jgi:hypothetical protein